MRTFQYSAGTSHRFWNIEVRGNAYVVSFGKVGSKGQTRRKQFPGPAQARVAANKLVRAKVARGYRETTARAAPAGARVPPLAQAMDATILDHPHALHYGGEAYIRLDDLRAVVKSPHLSSLKHLRLRLADFGDKGCEEIVKSGILQRLQTLDLRSGCIADAGARTLAACPDLKRLKRLDLSRNELTQRGIAALRAVGVPLSVERQHASTADAEPYERDFLYEGDIE
jgi:predicted DNA-binding WGR domain protein